MRISKTAGRKAAVAAVGVLAAAGIGGTAYAATGTGTAPANPPGSAPAAPGGHPARGGHRSLLERADHATIEVKVKGQWVTYTLDRGRVTAVSPASITLSRPDGQTVTEAIDAATRYGEVASESAIQLNRPATVLSDSGTALRIRQAPPAAGGTAGATP